MQMLSGTYLNQFLVDHTWEQAVYSNKVALTNMLPNTGLGQLLVIWMISLGGMTWQHAAWHSVA